MVTIIALAVGCVSDDDFGVPATTLVDIEAPENLLDMSAVLGQIGQSQNNKVTFPEDNELYMEGFVISSDEAGNYFEELIIQDAIENPTAGIKVLIDNSPLFTTYSIGQRVYIRLDGLTAGIGNGVPVIGRNGSNDIIEKIAPALQDQSILRDSEIFTIIPTIKSNATEFITTPLLTLIELPSAQFKQSDLTNRRTFASEPTDQFDGVRFIETCGDFNAPNVQIETSIFADFKGLRLPNGSGSITAILNRDFRDDNFVIGVNSPEDFDFDATVRCDFAVVSCGTVPNEGPVNLLSENFETQSTGAAAMPSGWTNFVEAGTVPWSVYTDANSLGKSVRVRPFNSGDVSVVSWLISPRFNFDAQTGEVLRFETSYDFFDTADTSLNMQVLFSSDWDGTPAGVLTATWEPLLDAELADSRVSFAAWVSSRNVSLDCVTGTGAFAFKYIGSGTDRTNDVTYELDNIRLSSN